jgi:hypothetical protein
MGFVGGAAVVKIEEDCVEAVREVRIVRFVERGGQVVTLRGGVGGGIVRMRKPAGAVDEAD